MSIYNGVAILLAILVCGCERPLPLGSKASHTQQDYDTALATGIHGIEVVHQFASVYPESEHFITHYAKELGGSTWNSKTGLHGRYVLTVQFAIEFDDTRHTPSRSGVPKFHLNEVESIQTLPDGRKSIIYKDKSLNFGTDEWKVLLENQGRLESIGVDVKSGGPVPGFEGVWKDA